MKKVFFIGFSFFVFWTNGQVINFTDNNLKTRLLQSSESFFIAGSGWDGLGPTSIIKIDANDNGEIEQSEALAVTYLNISDSGISNLSGMEYFTNLHRFALINNMVSMFDFPQMTYLEYLSVYNNNISSLNLSLYPNLKRVNCSYNSISFLDFTGLNSLEQVYCSHNLLSVLDFSENFFFKELGCEYNNLTSINIKNGAIQLFGSQTIYNECWGGNPNLSMICADDFEIDALQSFLTSCGNTQSITVSSSCQMGVDEQMKSSLTLFPNPSSSFVTFDFPDKNSSLISVKIYNASGVMISEVFPLSNGKTIDVANLQKGLYLLLVKYSDNNEPQLLKFFKN